MIENDGMLRVGDVAWFVGRTDGVLYKYSVTEKKIFYVRKLYEGKKSYYRLFGEYVFFHNQIILLPNKEENVVIYNPLNGDTRFIPVPNAKGKDVNVIGAWIINDMLYFVSAGSFKIFRMDSKGEIDTELEIQLEKKEQLAIESLYYKAKIYLICSNFPKIIIYDLTSKKQENVVFEDNIKGFGTIAAFEDHIYLTSYDNCIYTWNLNEECLTKTANIPEKCTQIRNDKNEVIYSDFVRSQHISKKIFFVPRNLSNKFFDGLVCYNVETKKIELIELLKDEQDLERVFKLEYWDEEALVICDYTGKHFLSLTIETGKTEKIDTALDYESFANNSFLDTTYEGGQLCLKDYLKIITYYTSKTTNKSLVEIGMVIHQEMMNSFGE